MLIKKRLKLQLSKEEEDKKKKIKHCKPRQG